MNLYKMLYNILNFYIPAKTLRESTFVLFSALIFLVFVSIPSNVLLGQDNRENNSNFLLEEAERLRHSKPDSAFLLVGQCLEKAKSNENTERLVEAIIFNSNLFRAQGELTEALNLLTKTYQEHHSVAQAKSKAELCYEIGRLNSQLGQIVESQTWIKKGTAICTDHDLSKKLGAFHNLAGNIFFERDVDSAKYYYNQALKIGIASKDSTRIGSSYGNLGRIKASKEGDYEGALSNYKSCLKIFEAIENTRAVALTHINIANALIKLDKIELVIEHQIKSLRINEKLNNKHAMVLSYQTLANTYKKLDRNQTAMEYYNKAIHMATDIKEFRALAISLQNKGGMHFQLENMDSAMVYFEKARTIAKRIEYGHIEGYSSFNIGATYMELGNYLKAEEFMLKAKDAFVRIGEEVNVNWVVPRIAEMYLAWSQEQPDLFVNKIDLDELEILLLESYQKNKEIGDLANRDVIFRCLNNIYDAKKDYKQKSFFQEELITLQDSAFNRNKLEIANEWAEKLQTAEKEKEIIQLESKNRITRFRTQILAWSLGLLVLFFGGLFYFWNKYVKQRHERDRILENELIRTKVSSDLHDDVGTMLSSLALQTEVLGLDAPPEKMAKFNKLTKLSREAMGRMRDTVWAIDSRKDSMLDLIDRMQDYLADTLGEKNISHTFDFNALNQKQTIAPDIRQNVYLIFKEAINNVVVHSNASKVDIVLQSVDVGINLNIADNGKFDPAQVKTSGTGLKNLKMRADRIGGKLDISMNNGFVVDLLV